MFFRKDPCKLLQAGEQCQWLQHQAPFSIRRNDESPPNSEIDFLSKKLIVIDRESSGAIFSPFDGANWRAGRPSHRCRISAGALCTNPASHIERTTAGATETISQIPTKEFLLCSQPSKIHYYSLEPPSRRGQNQAGFHH